MEMHQLRYMVAVARKGNFSRAAEHCHVSQPSLSQQILKLEDELDKIVDEAAPEWPVDQISLIDKVILRIAIYELLFTKDIPPKVSRF